MPSRVSPSLLEYSLEELEALLQAIKSAIADREAPAAAPPPPPPQPLPQPAPEPEPEPVPVPVPQPRVESAPLPPPPQPAEIRYMHPANRNMTWSGEGTRPEWIDAYLAQGGSWIALRNTAEKLGPRRR